MGQDRTSWSGGGTWTGSLGMERDRAWRRQRRWRATGSGCSWGFRRRKRGMRGAEYGNRGWLSNSRQSPATGPAQYIGASVLCSVSRLLPCRLSSPPSTSSPSTTTPFCPHLRAPSRHISQTTRSSGPRRSPAAPHPLQSPAHTLKPATTMTLSF